MNAHNQGDDRPPKASWAVARPARRLRTLATGTLGDIGSFLRAVRRKVGGERVQVPGPAGATARRQPPQRRVRTVRPPHRSAHARLIDLRTGWARWPAARGLRAVGQAAVLKPLLHSELAIESFGESVAEESAPALLVANHASHLDAAVIVSGLPAALRRHVVVAASADYFFDAWWRALPSALMFNSLPVHDGDVSGAVRLLARGWSVLVFGEPSRSRDGSVHDFDPVVGDLAAQADVPVIPVGIRGTFAAMPRGRFRIRRGRPRVSVRYGSTLRPGPGEDPAAFAHRVTEAVRLLIAEDIHTWWEVLRGRTGAEPEAGLPAAEWRRVWAQTDAMAKGGRSHSDRIWH